jgi:NADPH:quinone reductase-like Zn-dependent oxidoreductase
MQARFILIIFLSAAVTPRFAQSAPTMKAIVLHQFGGPEVLKYEDVPRPEPKADEVLVRVMAAGVNPVDAQMRAGDWVKIFGPKPPYTPGADIAGVIEQTGANVKKWKPGDPVYGYLDLDRDGGYAEYTIAKLNEIAAKPKSATFEEAASVGCAALTAWQALIDSAKLEKGQTVLIHGGSGGVGGFAIQIAKARGARVIATASTHNQETLKQLGADVPVDYTKQKFEEVAKDVDVVLDTVGGDTLARSYAVVKKGGFVATLVDRLDKSQLEQHGIRGESIGVKPDAQELAQLAELIDAKKIRPLISQVFPLSEAPKAHEQAATGHTRGKIVLHVADVIAKGD